MKKKIFLVSALSVGVICLGSSGNIYAKGGGAHGGHGEHGGAMHGGGHHEGAGMPQGAPVVGPHGGRMMHGGNEGEFGKGPKGDRPVMPRPVMRGEEFSKGVHPMPEGARPVMPGMKKPPMPMGEEHGVRNYGAGIGKGKGEGVEHRKRHEGPKKPMLEE